MEGPEIVIEFQSDLFPRSHIATKKVRAECASTIFCCRSSFRSVAYYFDVPPVWDSILVAASGGSFKVASKTIGVA